MSASSPRAAYRRGVSAALPFVIVVAPFGLLFGVVGTEAGLDIAQVMGFTVLVIAGASQFTALQLMADGAPTLIVVASALAVNLRMAMYSASLAPYLGQAPFWQRALAAYMNVDQTYALAHAEYEARPATTAPERMAFFFGTATPIIPVWVGATAVGIWVGAALPPALGLDFAVPITFIALIAPALRTLAHVAAAVTSVVMAILLGFLPWNLWLLAAGLAAMIVGAEVERRMEARR
ncbi:branched-chain amino acid ABC transporter permease [Rhodobacterales bacterium HKCCSP123]|nr:branched-chain amino acid ABC transporter permease [Rhodobacterales bacterium HKCCSP123]